MNKYSNDANTLEEFRKQYKELLQQHHSDNNGNLVYVKSMKDAWRGSCVLDKAKQPDERVAIV